MCMYYTKLMDCHGHTALSHHKQLNLRTVRHQPNRLYNFTLIITISVSTKRNAQKHSIEMFSSIIPQEALNPVLTFNYQ